MNGEAGYWLLRGSERIGPMTAEELVWRLGGRLEVLVCRSAGPPADRRGWKLGRFFPRLVLLRDLLQG